MDNYEKEGKHEKLGQMSLLASVKATPRKGVGKETVHGPH